MDEFACINTFIKVVEAGSFSAAARDESSTSAVARQVKSLEDDLGVRLLNRTTRSLSLTEPGRLLYERACSITRDLNSAKQEVQSFQENVKGSLRVSLRTSVGTTIIAPALPQLLRQYPDLNVDVTLTDERKDLVKENFDVALWMGELPDSENVAKRLCKSHRLVCASPEYYKQHGYPRHPRDLQTHNCIIFSGASYRNVWTFTNQDEQVPVTIAGSIRSNNGIVNVEAALAGIGIIVVNEWMVRKLISEGRLVSVLNEYVVNPTPCSSDLYVVYPSSRGMSRKVRVFVDFLVELLKPAACPPVSQSSDDNVVVAESGFTDLERIS